MKKSQAEYHGSLEADADIFHITGEFMEEIIGELPLKDTERGLQWSKL